MPAQGAGTIRICHPGGEGMFISALSDDQQIPDFPLGFGFGAIMVYSFLGVAIIADIFMGSIETVTSWKRRVVSKETGKGITVNLWHETVATLTLMALGSSAPEIFLAVIEIFKRGFHTGDLGPATIVGSAAFNLFTIIAVCIVVIPQKEVRRIDNMNAFMVTALFSVGAYMWMVFVLVIHGKDVVDIYEAVLTFLFLPLLVWVAYSADCGVIHRKIQLCWPDEDKDETPIDSEEYKVGFSGDEMIIPGSTESQHLEVAICRKGSCSEEVRCTYRTERMTAVPGYDYVDVAGIVEFQRQESEVMLQLEILPKAQFAVSRQFLLILESAEGACDFDAEGDGGKESAILTITVQAVNTVRSVSRSLDGLANKNSLCYGFAEWMEQFTSACYVNGSSEEQAEASIQDWVYHAFALPWKFLFAFVPPASFCGGWLCFFIAIAVIGLCTAFVSDVAEMVGCLLDIPDIVTATIFVALGTSMPDLFASLSAAVGDTTADASIVNVTGSNSVNVFLGLGIPWTCASIYWAMEGRLGGKGDWELRYPEIAENPKYAGIAVFVVESRNLGFCVLVFSGLCCVAIILLVMRRVYLGAELGGPSVPKFASGGLLLYLWLSFVALTSWRVLRCEGASPGHWCKASVMEQSAVVGTVIFSIFIVSIPTLISTWWYSKEAREEAKSQLKSKRWSAVFSDGELGSVRDKASNPGSKNADDSVLTTFEELERQQSHASAGTESTTSLSHAEKLRDAAGNKLAPCDEEAPAFDDFFNIKEARVHSEVHFLQLDGASTPRGGVSNTKGKSQAGAYIVSTLPSAHARNNASVTVIVVAYHSKGRNETVFQTRMSIPLRQVMAGWCKQHRIEDNKASFYTKSVSRPLEASDTVASVGHDATRGPLIIRARPNRDQGER
jgi:Ca2+/Na+ antiporter